MEYKLKVGDKVPSFHALDQEGEEVSDQDIIGSPFVLYFYPKDDTPGCTKEACSFRDHIEEFDNLDTIVVGISPDSVESHDSFMEKYDLNFALLADEEKQICKEFDVYREGGKIERTTFVCDAHGVIRWVERPVDVEGHTERVMQALTKYCS